MRRNVTNFMKRLRQILNHLCLLVNSALNTKCKDVSFLVEMCQFVVASLLKPVSCSCLKCTLSPSSCLNCFTWFHHLCQKYVCTCQMLEIQLTVTDARSFFGVSRKWRTSPDSLKRCSILRLAVFGGTITCLQTAHMKIFSLCALNVSVCTSDAGVCLHIERGGEIRSPVQLSPSFSTSTSTRESPQRSGYNSNPDHVSVCYRFAFPTSSMKTFYYFS